MCGIQVVILDSTSINLLLVSRQFYQEYRGRLPRDRTATLTKEIVLDFTYVIANNTIPYHHHSSASATLTSSSLRTAITLPHTWSCSQVDCRISLGSCSQPRPSPVHWKLTGDAIRGGGWKEFTCRRLFYPALLKELKEKSKEFKPFTINCTERRRWAILEMELERELKTSRLSGARARMRLKLCLLEAVFRKGLPRMKQAR